MKINNYLILIAAIAIIVAIFAIKGCYANKVTVDDLKANIAGVDSQEVKHWRDKYSIEHSTVQILNGEIGIMQVVHKKLFDSISLLLKIKPTAIISIQKIPFYVHDTPRIEVHAPLQFVKSGCDT